MCRHDSAFAWSLKYRENWGIIIYYVGNGAKITEFPKRDLDHVEKIFGYVSLALIMRGVSDLSNVR